MKFTKNLAVVHGYLCGDGYVIKNPIHQKHKYYYIGLRNTNATLLKDFQDCFTAVFGVKPIITEGRCKVQNKQIYGELTKQYSFYSYEWRLPYLSKENLKHWLRSFFDCEGWVENQPSKSRLIGLECCNQKGIEQISEALKKLGIESTTKKRKNRIIWRLTICGSENLKKFQKNINFIHPDKKRKLQASLDSYQNLNLNLPKTQSELLSFIEKRGRVRKERNEIRFLSVRKTNLTKLKKSLNKVSISSKIFGPWKNSSGSLYYCLTANHMEVQNYAANA